MIILRNADFYEQLLVYKNYTIRNTLQTCSYQTCCKFRHWTFKCEFAKKNKIQLRVDFTLYSPIEYLLKYMKHAATKKAYLKKHWYTVAQKYGSVEGPP